VETLDLGGFALGQGHGAELGYQSVTRPFAPGDMVILSSDGVVEANDAQDEMLGFDRLEAIIQQGPTTSAAAMLAYLKEAIATFTQGAEPHDDLTMMVVQLNDEL
jgi:sigma-B regulation protein RsbU (phosphoserine phosphatase)